MASKAFIRVANSWINPKYITSIAIVDAPKAGLFFKVPNAARVELKLTTQQAEVSGNMWGLSGSQKRCCYYWDFKTRKEANDWITQKFGKVLNGEHA